jgi:hypothetical protein
MSFQANKYGDSFDELVYSFTDMGIYDTIYNMTEPLQAIKHAGMDIIYHTLPAKRIIYWIATTDHDFPKSWKRWENLINTQFAIYPISAAECGLFSPEITTDTDGRSYIWYVNERTKQTIAVMDADRIIQILIRANVLQHSPYGRRLRVDVFKARQLAL